VNTSVSKEHAIYVFRVEESMVRKLSSYIGRMHRGWLFRPMGEGVSTDPCLGQQKWKV